MKDTKYIFERIIFGVLIIALLVVVGMAIYKLYETGKNDTSRRADDTLIEIESHLNYIIMYDKDTKVVYYRGKGGDADLLPLYNADGSLKIYSGGKNNESVRNS